MAGLGFFGALVASRDSAGGANFGCAAQLEHTIAGIVTRKPAQEADITAEGAAFKKCA